MEALTRLIGLIDLTALGATDTEQEVQALAARAISPVPGRPEIRCAAVCVWPNFAGTVSQALSGTDVQTACVAGAFPFSQAPLAVKVAEVRAAVEAGATEIDIAISRGLFLSGRHDELREEIAAMKAACGTAHLKVILETCDLPSDEAIRTACRLALEGGADFLKTSTGKGKHGATLPHTRLLLEAANEWNAAQGCSVGVKAAGGIRSVEEALAYLDLAEAFFSKVTASNFRIGASALLDSLAKMIS